MLENIKSIYFLKIVFSDITEKRQLQIVNYNKALQFKLEKNLIHYKILSGKYMIHETNTKVKIYNAYNDNLLFEGEYLNGKRNGKGKEYYDDGKLKYEGEYLNGKRNGKGKLYYKYGDLMFEGEYLNGNKTGKGKEYGYKGDLLYEGEYLNGKKWNGKGKINNYNGLLKYEIEYKNGKLWNVKQHNNQEIINVINEGKGLIQEYDQNNEIISFQCDYLNGERHGKMKAYYDNGKLKSEEDYQNGKRSGKVKRFYLDGKLKSEENYLNFKKNGVTKEYYDDGKLKAEKEYINDKIWNSKTFDQNNNIINELKEGKGYIKEYHDLTGKLIFEGEYLNGERNGKGKEYDAYNGKLIFEGEYLNGKRNGKGKEYYNNGKLRIEGVYLYNYKLKGKYYVNENLEYEGECRSPERQVCQVLAVTTVLTSRTWRWQLF